jgi:N-acetylneuraminic acid mutarotase
MKWKYWVLGGAGLGEEELVAHCVVCTHNRIGRNLYVFGGMGSTKLFADVCVFNVDTNAWTKILLPGTPKARFGHTATALGDR